MKRLLVAIGLVACGAPGVEAPAVDDAYRSEDPTVEPQDVGRTDCLVNGSSMDVLGFPTVLLGRPPEISTRQLPIDNLCDIPIEGLRASFTAGTAFSIPDPDQSDRIDAFRQVSLDLQFSPDSSGPAFEGTLLVEAQDQDPVEVRLSGAVATPVLGVAPAVLRVEGPIDCTTTSAVQVRNDGDLVMRVTEIDVQSEGPALTALTADLPWTLSPGQIRDLDISFRPEEESLVDATVLVTATHGDASDSAQAIVHAQTVEIPCP